MDNVGAPPDPLRTQLMGRDLILFDSECVLCSGFFRTMLKIDRHSRFSFATAQSKLGQSLYRALGLPVDDFETNLVIVNGRIYRHLDAFAAAMSAVGWPYRGLSVLRLLPAPLKRFLYFRIARNRYRLFGRYDTCLMPSPALQSRFLDLA